MENEEPLKPEIVDDTTAFRDTNTQQAWGTAVPTEGSAAIAFIFAIASWFVIPVIGAIIALYIAHGAKHRIRQSGNTLGGKALATAAQCIAIANLVAIALVIWLIDTLLRWIF